MHVVWYGCVQSDKVKRTGVGGVTSGPSVPGMFHVSSSASSRSLGRYVSLTRRLCKLGTVRPRDGRSTQPGRRLLMAAA